MSTLAEKTTLEWASDSKYGVHGKTWDLQNNKAEPSIGKKEEGMLPGEMPNSIEWNWWRNQVCKLASYMQDIHLLNYQEAGFGLVSVWATVPGGTWPVAICHDRSQDFFTALSNDGKVLYSRDPGAGGGGPPPIAPGHGTTWQDEAAISGSLHKSIASDQNGQRVICKSAFTVEESTAIGTWTSRTPPIAVQYHSVDHDWSGLWCVVGAIDGGGDGDGTIASSANGTSWTDRQSGVADDLLVVRHNKRSDGSARWVALGATYAIWSDDGITWSNAAHGMGNAPFYDALTYDEVNHRWICLLDNGDIGYSDDNGETWSVWSDPLGLAALTPAWYEIGIDCDRNGGVIVTYESYGGAVIGYVAKMWASKNAGGAWHRVYPNGISGSIQSGPCWGGDRFAMVGDTGALYSLRLFGD